jgi:pseudaminic acid synthase
MGFKIDQRVIDEKSKVFIVAELSANHMQDFEIAVKTVIAAKEAGADAIKLQTYTPDTMTIDCGNRYFQINQGTLWDGLTLYQLYQRAYTPWEWQSKLKAVAEDNGLIFFSTPFDNDSVDFLEDLDVPVYKIASFEIGDIPFIEYAASKGKPLIISTGIAERRDIQEAVDACYRQGNKDVALLKCTSAYPAPIDEINLNTIPHMAAKFDVIVGLSDHTSGIHVPVASVCLGTKIVEKHLTLDKKLGSLDAPFSLDPVEFKAMVNAIREVECAMGGICYKLTKNALKNKVFARSLFVVEDINKGDAITYRNVRSIRPGHGISPKHLTTLIGEKVNRDISRGNPLTWDIIDKK